MMPARRRPTAADVAERSGVSTATVSYVLNQTPGQTIPEATRSRVLAAAADLGYVQHAAAQTLAKGTSRVIIIDMSPVVQGSFAEAGARILSADIEAMGYVPLVSWSATGLDPKRLMTLARAVAPAAVLTALPLPEHVREGLLTSGVRAVASLVPDDQVDVMAALPAALQISRLKERGHRVVLFAPPAPGPLDRISGIRASAVEAAAHTHGMQVSTMRAADTIADLSESLTSTLELAPDATAVAAYDDDTAMRVIAALHRTSHTVPDDVAVIGVGDLPLAEAVIPPLTTVRYVFEASEPTGPYLQALLDSGQVAGEIASLAQSVRAELVLRESA